MTTEVPDSLQQMDSAQLRVLAASLMVTLQGKGRELARKSQELLTSKTLNEKLTFEIAQLRRFKFGKRGEQLHRRAAAAPLAARRAWRRQR